MKKIYYQKENVLFENGDNKKYLFGYTDNYVKVKVKRDKSLIGKVKNTLLQKIDLDMNLIGIIS